MNELDLFIAGLEVDDPLERAAYLDQVCGNDNEMRKRLGALMVAIDQPSALLEGFRAAGQEVYPVETERITVNEDSRSAASSCEQTESHQEKPASPASLIDSTIAGRYKLRQEIGEGGMGSVYLAEQTEPVKRTVALKLIKPGLDSKSVLAPF